MFVKDLVFHFICYRNHDLSYQDINFELFKQIRMEKMTKTTVVDRDEFYNFVVDDFSVIQTKYDGKMTKTKVVDLN